VIIIIIIIVIVIVIIYSPKCDEDKIRFTDRRCCEISAVRTGSDF